MTPDEISTALERILPAVEKPARYVGGELHQVVKPWDRVPLRIALCFPDLYDIGMPNNGLAILYDIVNRQPEMLAERAYLPWFDMQARMRERGVPLYSLETKHPLSAFDIVGVSLPYEMLYSNLLSLLDLGGIALRSSARGDAAPLVIAGGHATFNPEPVAPFVDAFVIGEGKEIIVEIGRCVRRCKERGASRDALLRELAQIWGVYVPTLHHGTAPAEPGVSPRVSKRIVAELPPPITRPLVPNLETVHHRISIEIMRGCTRGCRFCHAGMVTRPVRERPVAEIADALEQALDATGFDEVGLLSLSSSDYRDVLELVQSVRARFGERRLNISLPSLRIESFSIELMDALQGSSRRSGFTLAPEAASERMREIINKPVPTEQLLETAREVYRRGWHTLKLYFMIGHPAETAQDVEAIAELCHDVLAEGRAQIGSRAKLHVGVSTFVPKPHTPFQWAPCATPEQIRSKQALLRQRLRSRAIKLGFNTPAETQLEAWLSRGDRKLADVIERAWQLGAGFDAWSEHLRHDLWLQAFAELGVDADRYAHRERSLDEPLPWDHIDCAVDKRFLREDYRWSLEGRTRVDCRDQCFACGILPKFKRLRREHPGPVWECPDVSPTSASEGLSGG